MLSLVTFIGAIIVTLCTVISVLALVTPIGKAKIKVGSDWSLFTWIAAIFIAGTGVALVCAVPSDIKGLLNDGMSPIESIIMSTLWNGFPCWAVFAVVGYWYIKHPNNKFGKVMAMLSTIIGMAISLWTGTRHIVRMLGFDFVALPWLIAGTMVIVALWSAYFNKLKWVSRISFIIFLICATIVLSVKCSDEYKISGTITLNMWKEYFFGETSGSWWWWFVSWTPTVSRWLANISKGKSIKTYVIGTMIIPSVIALVWSFISYKYTDLILGLSIVNNPTTAFVSIMFIFSGLMFMAGTLDSDCKVFTEDLEFMCGINRRSLIPVYGFGILVMFGLYTSGRISNPFGFNEYCSLIFLPICIFSMIAMTKDSIKSIKFNGNIDDVIVEKEVK